MLKETLTIGEMCKAFNTTARTLRFYETKELLSPLRVRNHRLFTRRDQARLKLILAGKRFGFSLEQIRHLLDLYDTDGGAHHQRRETLRAAKSRLAEMIEERAKLDLVISELQTEIARVARIVEAEEAVAPQRVAS